MNDLAVELVDANKASFYIQELSEALKFKWETHRVRSILCRELDFECNSKRI